MPQEEKAMEQAGFLEMEEISPMRLNSAAEGPSAIMPPAPGKEIRAEIFNNARKRAMPIFRGIKDMEVKELMEPWLRTPSIFNNIMETLRVMGPDGRGAMIRVIKALMKVNNICCKFKLSPARLRSWIGEILVVIKRDGIIKGRKFMYASLKTIHLVLSGGPRAEQMELYFHLAQALKNSEKEYMVMLMDAYGIALVHMAIVTFQDEAKAILGEMILKGRELQEEGHAVIVKALGEEGVWPEQMWESIEFALSFKDETKGIFGPRKEPDWKIVDRKSSLLVMDELREMQIEIEKCNGGQET